MSVSVSTEAKATAEAVYGCMQTGN